MLSKSPYLAGQKAPSAIRCIKTFSTGGTWEKKIVCQKAPSAIRCIKTVDGWHVQKNKINVRKHRAP